MSQYESIEPQFDLAAQEAKVADRKEKPPYVYDRDAVIAAAELAEKARELEALADEIEKEALEAEKAALEPVPEVPGKVEQEPEITPEQGSGG